MKYQKQVSIIGAWVKAGELTSVKAKIVSETIKQESQFQDKDGKTKYQDVAKVRFEGVNDPMNVALNRATINGLIDAFGEDSVDWQNKVLLVETEKMRVAGKAVTALYLVPEGYKKIDDDNGYAVIIRNDETLMPTIQTDNTPMVEYPDEEINSNDIPF